MSPKATCCSCGWGCGRRLLLRLRSLQARQADLAARLKADLDRWSRSVAQSRAEARLWADAQRDPRVMAELQAALQRDLPEAPECGADDARSSHIGYGIVAAHIRRGRALA